MPLWPKNDRTLPIDRGRSSSSSKRPSRCTILGTGR
jgi:hypothetical protein